MAIQSFRLTLAFAVGALCGTILNGFEYLYERVCDIRGWVLRHVRSAFRTAPDRVGFVAHAPERELTKANAYAVRMNERSRPRIEGSWRMVPSA